MSRNLFSSSSLRTTILSCVVFAFLVQAGRAQDALQFFKNYFVTGDYRVAGTGLRGTGDASGFGTGVINMTDVPGGADIVAAFLYWETIEKTATPSSGDGWFKAAGTAEFQAIVGKPLGNTNAAACWSSGGGTGTPQGGATLRVYRADVLRYLMVGGTPDNPVRVANGTHTVMFHDSGSNGNAAPQTEGASLVVVYRVIPSTGVPLRAVVIYDGAYTLGQASEVMSQTIGGFYQADASPAAKMTQIVGDGQSNFNESLTVNGSVPAGVSSDNPFQSAQGPSWDNLTFLFNLGEDASSLETEVAPVSSSFDCLSWGAIVTSMNVKDPDGDGLLSIWEQHGLHLDVGDADTPATFGTCTDFPDTCVDLPAMGDMDDSTKDIFIEIDWLKASTEMGGDGHEHKPKLEALKKVAAAFREHGIRLHFDVGNNYQDGSDPFLEDGYRFIVPFYDAEGRQIAEGGQVVDESVLICPNAVQTDCTFSGIPVQSWKTGFSAVENGYPVLGIAAHQEHDRKDVEHYVIFGHAVQPPTTQDPPVLTSYSGAGDRPGGHFIVTLGLWRSDNPDDDQVGSVDVQAGTLMHELGHNLNLRHAGADPAPNCKPDYQSVMNYGYQRGLTDASGDTQVNYSDGNLAGLDENELYETEPFGPSGAPYRVKYYGPASPLDLSLNAQAKVHCDGTPLDSALETMVRLESSSVVDVDWNNDGAILSSGYSVAEDANFNGTAGDAPQFSDFDDWDYLDPRQIGGSPNVGGLSADVGLADLGLADLGLADLGLADLGLADLGLADLGLADLGLADLGLADLGELDFDTVIRSASDSPRSPTATSSTSSITVNWNNPGLGNVVEYRIYRTAEETFPASATPFATVSGSPPDTMFIDTVDSITTLFDTTYQYVVTAVIRLTDGTLSETGPSKIVTGYVSSFYNFIGFSSPLAPSGNYAGSFNLGKAIPVKWQLTDSSGAFITNLDSLTRLSAVYNSNQPPRNQDCGVETSGPETVFYAPTTGATGGSTFRVSSQRFIFNADTSSMSQAGCYTLLLQLDDGSALKTNSFRLR